MFYNVRSDWVSIPFWDEWTTPGALFVSRFEGHATLADLVAQHNESRKLFPRLLYLVLVQFGSWDVRKEMVVTFATVCGISLLFSRLMQRTAGASTVSALVAWVSATFLCFIGSQTDNFLWGIQFEPFVVGLAVFLVATVNVSKLSLPWEAALNAALALVASYTIVNGILLWVLGLPIANEKQEGSRGTKLLSYGSFAACGAVAIAACFHGYKRPDAHVNPLFVGSAMAALFFAAVVWVTATTEHNLFAHGWAWVSERLHRADCIVIGCADAAGSVKPISTVETGSSYANVPFKKHGTGFARALDRGNIPPGDITVAGWAVDLHHHAAFPPGGVTHISAAER